MAARNLPAPGSKVPVLPKATVGQWLGALAAGLAAWIVAATVFGLSVALIAVGLGVETADERQAESVASVAAIAVAWWVVARLVKRARYRNARNQLPGA